MKERLVNKWQNWTTSSKVFFVLWICVYVGTMLYAIIHPRPSNIVIAGLSTGFTYIIWMQKRAVGSYVVLFSLLLCIGILFLKVSIIDLLYTRHARWEYKGDIKEFKHEYPEEFQAFPKKLPKGAKEVYWRVCPGYMQGSSFEVLRFKAPLEYIDEVVEEFGPQAQRFVYDTEYYEFPTRFTYDSYMTEVETTELYVLHYSGDWDYSHTYGFWVNRSIGEIGFYEE